jgi:hypothetical protein
MIVYWIKLKSHTDVFSQGYVGVTKRNIYQRFSEHKNLNRNVPLKNAIKNMETIL